MIKSVRWILLVRLLSLLAYANGTQEQQIERTNQAITGCRFRCPSNAAMTLRAIGSKTRPYYWNCLFGELIMNNQKSVLRLITVMLLFVWLVCMWIGGCQNKSEMDY